MILNSKNKTTYKLKPEVNPNSLQIKQFSLRKDGQPILKFTS